MSNIEQVLLEVVAEKTGYPAEMLEPTMQLDADLGIDSIKRVEILSALQERLPDAPAVKPEHLGTLRTLQDIADFLSEDRKSEVKVTVQTAPALLRFEVIEARLDDSDRGGVPAIRTGGEIYVSEDNTGLSAALVKRLCTRGYHARLLALNMIPEKIKDKAIDGLILIASSTTFGSESGMIDCFRALRAAAPGLRRAGAAAGAAFVTVTRLDGSFGFGTLSPKVDPESGGLAGLSKTAGREWPEVSCKAIDIDPALGSDEETVSRLADEILRQGPAEVGLARKGRQTLVLNPSEIAPGHVDPFNPGDLVVITGGARGVTAEIAVALSKTFRPTLLLLGRTESPKAEPAWLVSLETESEIKSALASRANGRATPQLVGERYNLVAANREILGNLRRIEEAGGKALYRQVDVRDSEAVSASLQEVTQEFGPVRGLIHGAGVLADRRIEDKTDAQFDFVYKTKIEGFQSLMKAVGTDDLRVIVAFSSTTARFGRTGQIAYASANEVLNKLAQREARRRPECRVVSINWGPWNGGMVSPGLKPLFQSEGVGLIPLEAGSCYLVDELRSSRDKAAVEIMILGPGSVLPDPPRVIKPPYSPATIPATTPEAPAATRSANLAEVFSRALDVEELPILRSHVIDGRAVLPTALILEWLAQGAIQRNPGLSFRGIDDLRILKGAVVHEDRPETVTVLAGKAVRDGSIYRVSVELRGEIAGGKTVAHARGEVVLGDRLTLPDQAAMIPGVLPHYARSTRSVYHDILFHGPDLHGLERIDACAPDGIVATARTAPEPTAWVERPHRQSWLTDPLVVDCAFQLMVLWCHENAGGASLPTALGRYRQFCFEFTGPRVQIVARVDRPSESRATADIDFVNDQGLLLARIVGYECVIDSALHAKFRRNRLAGVTRGPR